MTNLSLDTPLLWQGRDDSAEAGDNTRFYQLVQPYTDVSRGGIALIGFAVDEGVRRNQGRVGASLGPEAMRKHMCNLVLAQTEGAKNSMIWDAGDIQCQAHDLETAQSQLAKRVSDALQKQCFPLVLGGGHEVAWGSYQGIALAKPEIDKLLIINFDAHFDLRKKAEANSGTPFWQIAQQRTKINQPFLYHVLGISTFNNTQALFETAAQLKVHYVLDEYLQTEAHLQQASATLLKAIDAAEAIYLSICLDVLPAHQAPGVSAPASLGVPFANILQLLQPLLTCKKLILTDIAELNPTQDPDHRTTRLAARLAMQIIRGVQGTQPRIVMAS